MAINPAGSVPVIADTNLTIVGYYAITEYIAEKFGGFFLMPKTIEQKTATRQEIYWFNDKFYREVSKVILEEKMIRLLQKAGNPRMEYIRIAKANLSHHLKYLTNKLEQNTYITTENLTCADIVAAAHISTVDYFGEVNWDSWPLIKQWYSVIKSRPSFRSILQDHIAGFPPRPEYADLDF